ncbi:hypothetical protein CASFOL_040590 [Castilleja foliolosa]|uniref:HMA domain-containing protein n=1 Tax=Castilleja foliolosa TaxID=1961234 RepID=A0ABD3BCP4_9LAMI
MATEKETIMVLKVDLQCPSCYKKTKKTLCKFPQVQDQIYDEKANTVTIRVVCCSPEKIRDKLCCRGGKAIKSIEIKEPGKPEKKKEPEKPKQPEKPKEAEKSKEKDKPKGPEKPKVTIIEPKEAGKPKEAEKPKPKPDGKGDKPKSNGAPPPAEKPAEKPKEAPKPEPAKSPGGPQPGPVMIPFPAQPMKGPEPVPVPANGVPSVFPYVGPTYDGYGAGPYYHGYGFPAPPSQPCYEGYYGHAHGYGYGYDYGRVAHVNRSDNYYGEEESQTCSIM